MFRNQYVISESSSEVETDAHFKWQGLHVFLGDGTDAYCNETCLIIGKIVSSFDADFSVEQIASLVSSCESVDDVCRVMDGMSGRYVMACRNGQEIFVMTDACGFKRALFNSKEGKKSITSSELFASHVLGIEISIKDSVKEMMLDEGYRRKESPWFGMTSFDEKFKFLIPNHYLTFGSLSLKRMKAPHTDSDITASSAQMLSTTMNALAKRYALVQPLTAGVDSRMLLAAASSVKDNVSFYVFGEKGSKHEDVDVPQALSLISGVKFEIVSPEHAPESFKTMLKGFVLGARDLPKVNNIYEHFKNKKKYVNINGNGAEIFRSYYGASNLRFSSSHLSTLSGTHKWPLLGKKIADWMNSTEARVYAKENDIAITDLFYWEQRMAIWGSMFPAEQDVAIDEVSPFSNRKLIFTLLKEPKNRRRSPHFVSAMNVIDSMDARLTSVPINPDSSRKITGFIKGNTMMQLIAKRVKG